MVISSIFNVFEQPVLLPRSDALRCLPRLISLLKVLPRSQIMPLQPINENVFYPSHKETLSKVIFGKIGGPY